MKVARSEDGVRVRKAELKTENVVAHAPQLRQETSVSYRLVLLPPEFGIGTDADVNGLEPNMIELLP